MTTNDHIAAIKEHLKAIEAEKQPKKGSTMYFVARVQYNNISTLCWSFVSRKQFGTIDPVAVLDFINSGKIITVNEE